MAAGGKGMESSGRGNGIPRPDRIVRISMSDPDATDSSSDDEEYEHWKPVPSDKAPPLKCKPRKRVSVTINMYKKINKKSEITWSFRPPTTFPEFPGAHLRAWGKWASVVKDPFQKNKRIWLGTFKTAEEASQAHLAKKREFEEKLAKPGLKYNQGNESAGTSSSNPSRNEEAAEEGTNLGPKSRLI